MALNHPDGSDQSAQEPQEAVVEKWKSTTAEQQQESHTSNGEEAKGTKRKREEMQGDEMEESSKRVTNL